MDDLFSETGIDSIHIVIGREQIESKDYKSILDSLIPLFADRNTIMRFRSSVILSIDGYNNDASELFEIDDVRNYIKELDSRFPYWFFFLSLQTSSLKMIALCLCKYKKASNTLVNMDNDDLKWFLESHIIAMNQIFDTFSIDGKLNEEMTKNIIEHFSLK